jgi:hypothetical protein
MWYDEEAALLKTINIILPPKEYLPPKNAGRNLIRRQ